MSVENTAVPGSLNERNDLRTKPRGAMRWKYWSLVGVLMMVVFISLLQRTEPLSFIYMGIFCAIALAAALYQCGEIWTLRAKRSPRWLGYVAAFGSAAIIGTLLVLHDLNMFRWNHLYFGWPFGLFCAVTAVGAWVTEWHKRVRVYAEVEGFVFVPVEDPSNIAFEQDAPKAARPTI